MKLPNTTMNMYTIDSINYLNYTLAILQIIQLWVVNTG